jgi:SagB-type dehydrogenase family enzyme
MIRWPATELDPTSFPAWRDAIVRFEAEPAPDHAPRSYPGYPRVPLPRARRRWRSALDRTLASRRSAHAFTPALPPASLLGPLCELAHGVTGDAGRGPVPSAGGLQALELYVAVRSPGWLAAGVYHYDRGAHALSSLGVDPVAIEPHVPALHTVDGGALLWLIAGDGARVEAKYGARGLRFLLLEAGHLMQNLCLAAGELGLATLPLGGFYERPLANALQLPASDELLYVAVGGHPQ